MDNKIWRKTKTTFSNFFMAFQSICWKRDASVVLVGSWFGEKFADNSRYLFQYLSDNKDELELSHVVWVTRSNSVVKQLDEMGYEAYLMDSEESIKYHKTAKYHLICDFSNSSDIVKTDILTKYSYGAIKVNLWHGVIGFKGVGMASQGYIDRKKRHPVIWGTYEKCHKTAFFRKFIEQPGGWGDCYYLSTTAYRTNTLMKYFALPLDHYIETGFARVAGKVRLLPIEEQVISTINKYNNCIIYLPTFRGDKSSFDFNEASLGMKSYLEQNNILWIQKFHSASANRTDKLEHKGSILTLPHDYDINTIIPLASIIITDYSSVTGDAMYFYKPLIFYVPDIEEYSSGDRGFVIKPDEIMCGPKAFTTEELQQFVTEYINNEFNPDNKYRMIRRNYFGSQKTLEEIWIDIKNNAK